MGLWSLSWILYSLRFAVLLLLVLVINHPFILFLNQSFALVSGLLLFAGTAVFAGKPVNRLFIVFGVLGVFWIALGIATKIDFLWLTLPTFSFLSLVSIWTGLLIMNSSITESAPKKVTAYAFILWGIHKFNFPFLRDVEWFAPWGYLIAAGLGLVISLGILLIYSEELGEKLLSAKNWHESLFSRAGLGAAVADAQTGIIVSCNPKLADMLGYRIDEIVGQHQNFLHSKDNDREFSACFQEHIDSPGKSIETQMVRKNGSTIDVEIQATHLAKNGEQFLLGFFYDLTERKKSEEIIRFNKARYKNIVENTEDLIARVDTKGIIKYVNPSSQRIWGLSPEECVGKLSFDLTHPEDKQHTQESFQSWLESDQDYVSFENRQLHVSGKATTLLWTISATRNQKGEIVEFTSIARDIENIRNEEKLQSALFELIEYANDHGPHELLEEFLKKAELLTDSKIGFYHFVDEDTGHVSLQVWSQETREKFCRADGEGYHYPISEAGVWIDAIRQRQPVIHNDYQNLPHKQGLPAGHTPVIREMVIPVFRENQIVAILGVGNKETDYDHRDIRVIQKLADLAWEIVVRKQAEEALRESEERFQKMFREHDAVMLLIDPDTGQVLDANNAAAGFYGHSLEAFRGLLIQDINTLPEREVEIARRRAQAGEQTCFEFRHKLSNGEIKDVEVHVSNIELNKQPVLFSIVHDISQRQRLMEEQSRSAQLAALGTVAAGVAHEINNPIQGILNYAGLIARHPERSERNLDIARRIERESLRIAKITQDLLFYSKDSRIDMKRVDVREVIAGALSLIATKLRSEGVALNFQAPDEFPLLRLQPQSLQQVIINLVDNAYDALRIKTNNTAEKTITVTTSLLPAEDQKNPLISIEISDNGVGMTEEVRQKALEAFFTTKPPSEGTGLGLSIVNDIIKKHDGRMEIDSKANQYTRIKVFIPAITEE